MEQGLVLERLCIGAFKSQMEHMWEFLLYESEKGNSHSRGWGESQWGSEDRRGSGKGCG